MRIVFFGSDDFAAVHLEELIHHEKFDVVGCVTQPDRPKGRGMKVILSPIKELALEHAIDVLQPTDMKDENFVAGLKQFDADVFVCDCLWPYSFSTYSGYSINMCIECSWVFVASISWCGTNQLGCD